MRDHSLFLPCPLFSLSGSGVSPRQLAKAKMPKHQMKFSNLKPQNKYTHTHKTKKQTNKKSSENTIFLPKCKISQLFCCSGLVPMISVHHFTPVWGLAFHWNNFFPLNPAPDVSHGKGLGCFPLDAALKFSHLCFRPPVYRMAEEIWVLEPSLQPSIPEWLQSNVGYLSNSFQVAMEEQQAAGVHGRMSWKDGYFHSSLAGSDIQQWEIPTNKCSVKTKFIFF